MSYLRVDASSSDWYSAVCSLSPNKHSGGNSQHLVMRVFDFCLARKALGGRYNAAKAGGLVYASEASTGVGAPVPIFNTFFGLKLEQVFEAF